MSDELDWDASIETDFRMIRVVSAAAVAVVTTALSVVAGVGGLDGLFAVLVILGALSAAATLVVGSALIVRTTRVIHEQSAKAAEGE